MSQQLDMFKFFFLVFNLSLVLVVIGVFDEKNPLSQVSLKGHKYILFDF